MAPVLRGGGGGGTDNRMNFEWSITPRIRTRMHPRMASAGGWKGLRPYYWKTVNISRHIRANGYKRAIREDGREEKEREQEG